MAEPGFQAKKLELIKSLHLSILCLPIARPFAEFEVHVNFLGPIDTEPSRECVDPPRANNETHILTVGSGSN